MNTLFTLLLTPLAGPHSPARADTSAHVARESTTCDEALARTTYEELAADVERRRADGTGLGYTTEYLAEFHRSGLRHVRALEAAAPGAVIDRFDAAAETLDDLRLESAERFGTPRKPSMRPDVRASFAALAIPQDRERFGTRELRWLRKSAHHFRVMAAMVTVARDYFGLGPGPDPFAPMTEAWVRAVLDDLHHVSTEFALRESEEAEREMRESWRHAVPTAPVAPNETAATAPDFLALIATEDPVFDADVTYVARLKGEGFDDQPLRIRLHSDVIKDLAGSGRTQGLFLLRALLKTQRADNGIKRLTSLGKSIVEIKRVMRGHLRFIGCLEGDHLRLLQLREMPEKVDSYSRLIPSNLCADR